MDENCNSLKLQREQELVNTLCVQEMPRSVWNLLRNSQKKWLQKAILLWNWFQKANSK